jgi:prepilin-type N-terminal cleavage/methylation domain-containing protein
MVKRTSQKGFTLIEMVVAIMIFVMVAMVALGALLKIIDSNKKSQAMKTAITNMNFALESMTRDLRVGSTYNCYNFRATPLTLTTPQACASASGYTAPWTIAFNSSFVDNNGGSPCNLIHMYYFDGHSIFKGEQDHCGQIYNFYPVIYGTNGNRDDAALNDSAITFTTGTLRVSTGTGKQPYAQFHFAGSAGVKEKLKSPFDVQTTVTQRVID